MAAPAAAPAIIASVSGVSSTRFSPYFAKSPSVAPKTPPFLPTSSPRTMTFGSRSSSSSSAVRIASRMFSSATSAALLGVDEALRGADVGVRPRLGALACLVDLVLHLGAKLLVTLVGQQADGPQLRGEADERILALQRLDLGRVAIAALVVVRRVAGEPHHHGLDQGRTLAPSSPLVGFPRGRVAAQRIGAVHGHAREAVSLRSYRHALATDLLVERDADRVAVVLADEDDRQLVDAGEVHGLVDLALVAGALAVCGHGHHVVAAHPGAHGDADRVKHLRPDRRRERDEVVRGAAVMAGHLATAGADVVALGEVGGDDVLDAHAERQGRCDRAV